MFLRKSEIIDKINKFSALGDPFLFVLDFSGENGIVMTPEEANKQGIRYVFENPENDVFAKEKTPYAFSFDAVDFLIYKKAFEKVMFHLQRGDTYLLNLTFQTHLQTDLTMARIFAMSRARYKIYIPGHFVVFSPESFVQMRNSVIISCPMKGTIDASVSDAEALLLADEKELFEHNTIVDLIRNDLSMVSTGVRVSRFRYIERIRTNRGDLLQMSSEIRGNLPENWTAKLGEILYALLPAGSVSGAPKERTVEIIKEAETYDRGFYTGIFGFFDGSSVTSAVSIRFIEEQRGVLVFKSGGGITAMSDAEKEYREMLRKIYVPAV